MDLNSPWLLLLLPLAVVLSEPSLGFGTAHQNTASSSHLVAAERVTSVTPAVTEHLQNLYKVQLKVYSLVLLYL